MAAKRTPVVEVLEPHIDCCFSGCVIRAVCRVRTNTGWANVCKVHYPQVEQATNVRTVNYLLEEIRAAHRKSRHYRENHPAETKKPLNVEAELAAMKEGMSQFDSELVDAANP